MEPVLKSRDLIPGIFIIESYEPVKSTYGVNYLITAEHESGEKVRFWSNIYLSSYITATKPTKKFNIEFFDSKITIPGYSRKVILK
jgi:hypothetical protein